MTPRNLSGTPRKQELILTVVGNVINQELY